MSSHTTTSPQDQVAALFMERKGYPEIKPQAVEFVGDACWYYYYQLPEGTVELEVAYNRRRSEWETMVTAFDTGVSASSDTL